MNLPNTDDKIKSMPPIYTETTATTIKTNIVDCTICALESHTLFLSSKYDSLKKFIALFIKPAVI